MQELISTYQALHEKVFGYEFTDCDLSSLSEEELTEVINQLTDLYNEHNG